MDKECGKKMIKKILISMREDIKMIKSMAMENFNGIQAVNIRETMFRILKKVMAKCIGLMELFIEVIGMKDSKME
jgi:hypothetical protein